MKYGFYILLVSMVFIACGNEDLEPQDLEVPATYSFSRDQLSSVNFQGQIDRIQMAEELTAFLKGFNASEEKLLEMFRNRSEDGSDVDPFLNPKLNVSTKSIKDKVAASIDYFATNAAESGKIKLDFETWISSQMNTVLPNQLVAAEPGVAGQINDAGTPRYVNGKGLEYDQIFEKGLIGALMVDQMLNNYLSASVLDNGDNRANNDAGILSEGKNYTAMEHKWDEAYGYLFGNAQNLSEPLIELGDSDNFLNKYLARVNNDPDFDGIAVDIYNSLKQGRAAIVEAQYDLRDEAAHRIKQDISKVVAIRSVYYLQQAKFFIEAGQRIESFHDLSEGIGFIYSLRFTRNPETGTTYFTREEVDSFINLLEEGNGFWGITPTTLDEISSNIASKFDFSVAQAAQ